jgi:hypothetical protein
MADPVGRIAAACLQKIVCSLWIVCVAKVRVAWPVDESKGLLRGIENYSIPSSK